jgi:hypothetical protein
MGTWICVTVVPRMSEYVGVAAYACCMMAGSVAALPESNRPENLRSRVGFLIFFLL